jgi:hypothetical protein
VTHIISTCRICQAIIHDLGKDLPPKEGEPSWRYVKRLLANKAARREEKDGTEE